MIKINNLTKTYKLDEQDFKALDDINLNVKEGEFLVILGQSGCGKSTLLNIIGGMDRATSGSIEVGNYDLGKKKNEDLARYRRETIGMIFQKFNLINDATVLENVMLPLKFSGFLEKIQKQKAITALKNVGLEKRKKSTPSKLSGGQQQRVAIARALVNEPKILLCDEPTGNLDSKTGKEIIDLLVELNKNGQTIIMVTHNEDYEKYAHRVVKMLDGKIIEDRNNRSVAVDFSKLSERKTKNISIISRLSLALKNLKRRKLRFFLTSFGVAIGAMAIVILVSFGAGLQRDVQKQISDYSQVEEIRVTGEKAQEVNFSMGPTFAQTDKKPLNDSTIEDLKKIPNVESAYISDSAGSIMTIGDKTSRMFSEASNPIAYTKQEVKDKVKIGKFFASDDENSVIIPYAQATALGFENPNDIIGKEATVRDEISNREFKVNIVGVFGKEEKFTYSTLVPQKTAMTWVRDVKSEEMKQANPSLYDSIIVRATNASTVNDVKKAIDDKGYGTSSYADIAKSMARTFTIMQIVLGVVGGIALLVASLGIVNTMLMSILERTKEIGIMKAVGARSKDIQSIFLQEALLIGLFGGLVGLGLGYLGSKLAGVIANTYMTNAGSGNGQSLSFYVPAYLAFAVVIFSVFVSGIAGFLPAKRAANLDPAVALRED